MAIFSVLSWNTPDTNQVMKDMAMSYREKSEGYRFLFNLSCLCLWQLVEENVDWGPEWVEEWTPLQYLAKL